jgi:hypothetical protein
LPHDSFGPIGASIDDTGEATVRGDAATTL